MSKVLAKVASLGAAKVAKLKAKAVAASSDASTLAESRAKRIDANSKLTGHVAAKVVATEPAKAEPVAPKAAPIVVPQLPPPLPRAAYVKAPPVTIDQAPKAVPAKADKPAEAEMLAPAQVLELPMKFVEAALACTAGKNEVRSYLQGVHIHQLPAGPVRVVSTDGNRVFVASIENPPEQIAWAAGHGITLAAADLARIVRCLKGDALSISFGVNHPKAVLTDPADTLATFSVVPRDDANRYPDYQRIIDQSAAVFTSERRPMETSAIDCKYIKSAAVIAARIGAKGLSPFIGDRNAAVVFAFVDVPEALLYIAPLTASEHEQFVSAPALRLFGKASAAELIAKLEEQIKVSRNNAKTCKHKKFADVSIARAERLQARIDEIKAATSVKLAAPKAPEAPKVDAVVAAAVATAKAVTTASVH